jgi:hypothetical protein
LTVIEVGETAVTSPRIALWVTKAFSLSPSGVTHWACNARPSALSAGLRAFGPRAELSGAEVPGAELSGAEVPGAELPGAEVPGAELLDAPGLLGVAGALVEVASAAVPAPSTTTAADAASTIFFTM